MIDSGATALFQNAIGRVVGPALIKPTSQREYESPSQKINVPLSHCDLELELPPPAATASSADDLRVDFSVVPFLTDFVGADFFTGLAGAFADVTFLAIAPSPEEIESVSSFINQCQRPSIDRHPNRVFDRSGDANSLD